jgi:hypothetical protein
MENIKNAQTVAGDATPTPKRRTTMTNQTGYTINYSHEELREIARRKAIAARDRAQSRLDRELAHGRAADPSLVSQFRAWLEESEIALRAMDLDA